MKVFHLSLPPLTVLAISVQCSKERSEGFRGEISEFHLEEINSANRVRSSKSLIGEKWYIEQRNTLLRVYCCKNKQL